MNLLKGEPRPSIFKFITKEDWEHYSNCEVDLPEDCEECLRIDYLLAKEVKNNE